MRYKRLNIQTILLAFLAFAPLNGVLAQETALKISLSKDSILIGDQLTLLLSIPQSKSHQFAFPAFKDTIVPGITLVEDIPLDTLKEEGKEALLQKRYLITSFDSARYVFAVPYLLQRGNLIDTLFSDTVSLYVNTMPIDTAKYVMFDIKDTIQYPYTFKEILPWILLGIGGLLLIVLGIYLYLRRKKKQPLFLRPKKVDPPYLIAQRELQKLKEEKVWQQDKVKLYYTKLTDIFRVYIEDGFAVSAMEKTSQEILSEIEQSEQLKQYPAAKLNELFTLSDLAKFAKYTPAPDENERAYLIVSDFVEQTKANSLTQAQEVEELVEEAEEQQEEETQSEK